MSSCNQFSRADGLFNWSSCADVSMQQRLLLPEAQSVRSGCSFRHGAYKLEWYVDGMQTVHFQLTLSNIPFGAIGWTGVGFGNSMSTGLDVIIVRVMGSRVSVNDESVMGFRRPRSDPNQNVRMESASFSNGALRVHFSRPLRTNDAFADRNLSGCQPWQVGNFLVSCDVISNGSGWIDSRAHEYASNESGLYRAMPTVKTQPSTVIHLEVADDMHRMADYVSDFRTITYAGIVFSIIGALVFLIVKYRNKQNKPVPRGGEPSRQFQRYGGCQTYPWNGRDGVVIGVESPSFGSTRASDYTDMDGVPANCENARNNNAYYKVGENKRC
uniref:DOMON domain-containing protein n=1 Tax=Ascaris lumbricoides TaxID=6252 RepID=A0A0M3I8A6_ASCLU